MAQSANRRTPRRWLSRALASVVVAASIVIPAASASAAEPTDMVLEWNVNAIVTIHNAPTATPPGLGQAPPASGLQLAIVHLAIYDAASQSKLSLVPFDEQRLPSPVHRPVR